jgi:hypothetical protein
MVIQVLETVTKEEERKREGLGSLQPSFSSVWHTGLSGGAPDNVRWCKLVRGELAALEIRRRRTTIIHRTVRWCTGLSGEPTDPEDQWSDASDLEGNRAPDSYSDYPVVHRTIWCATRQKARIAFHVDLQRLLAALELSKGPLGAWRRHPSIH